MTGIVVSLDAKRDDYQKAEAEFKFMEGSKLLKYAERGNAKAQNALGDRYYNGENVEINYEEAVKWYEKSAQSGYDVAEYNLADMYY